MNIVGQIAQLHHRKNLAWPLVWKKVFFILVWWEIDKMTETTFGAFLSSNLMSSSQIATAMNSVVVEIGGTVLLLFLEQQKILLFLLLLLFFSKMFQGKVRS